MTDLPPFLAGDDLLVLLQKSRFKNKYNNSITKIIIRANY